MARSKSIILTTVELKSAVASNKTELKALAAAQKDADRAHKDNLKALNAAVSDAQKAVAGAIKAYEKATKDRAATLLTAQAQSEKLSAVTPSDAKAPKAKASPTK